MGKAVSDAQMRAAQHQLANCENATCRNHTKRNEDAPCAFCIRARKTILAYERSHQGGPTGGAA